MCHNVSIATVCVVYVLARRRLSSFDLVEWSIESSLPVDVNASRRGQKARVRTTFPCNKSRVEWLPVRTCSCIDAKYALS